jgi:protein tyrosine/serine phosphatase
VHKKMNVPPVAFGLVADNIYRSSHPSKAAYPYLENLCLKSAICLDGCDIRPEFREFCQSRGILLLEKNVGFNQEPFVVMSDTIVREVLALCMKMENRPCLLFCSNGRVMIANALFILSNACSVGMYKHNSWLPSNVVELEFSVRDR